MNADNTNGDVESLHDYTPFGYELATTYHINTHKFTGHERDAESGLDYMMARYYSQGQARFLSVDPVMGNTPNPQTWNLYAYVGNSPMKYVDPTGWQFMQKPADGLWVRGSDH